MKSLFTLLLIVSCAVSAAAVSSDRFESALVLTFVNVVDVRNGTIDHNVTVVIKDGRISGIAKVGFIHPGPKIRVVNAAGKYLIPGLWDMHVHSAFLQSAWSENVIYPLYLANGITGIRDMGGDFALLKQRRDRIEKGQLLGPHLVIAGPFLNDFPSDQQTIQVHTPDQGRQAVVALKQQGADFIKILSSIPRDTYFAIGDESRKQGIAFVGHLPDSVSLSEASKAGQRSIEHLSGLLLACSSKEEELRRHRQEALTKKDFVAFSAAELEAIGSYDPGKAASLFAELSRNNTWQVPTLVWTRAQANLEDPQMTAASPLKYVPAAVRAEWTPQQLAKDISPDQSSALKKVYARNLQLVADMHKAGVPFLAGSDGPDPYLVPGFSLHDELELLVQAGFTPQQALLAATYNPALFLNKADRYGSIEVGRRGDLVLLDANPLEDIHNTRKISGVILGGQYLSRTDLDKMLAKVEVAAQAAAPAR